MGAWDSSQYPPVDYQDPCQLGSWQLLDQGKLSINVGYIHVLNYKPSTNFWLFTKPTLLNSTPSAHRLRLLVPALVTHPELT